MESLWGVLVTNPIIIADGTSASGKSVVGEGLEEILRKIHDPKWTLLPSGNLYRAIGLFFGSVPGKSYVQGGIPLARLVEQEETRQSDLNQTLSMIVEEMDNITLEFGEDNRSVKVTYVEPKQGTTIQGFYTNEDLNQPDMSVVSARLGKVNALRPSIVRLEQEISEEGYWIIHGRDGKVVTDGMEDILPILFYTFCWKPIRALRRSKQRGTPYLEIYRQISKRDSDDTDPHGANLPRNPFFAWRRGYRHFINTTIPSIEKMLYKAARIVVNELEINISQNELRSVVSEVALNY